MVNLCKKQSTYVNANLFVFYKYWPYEIKKVVKLSQHLLFDSSVYNL